MLFQQFDIVNIFSLTLFLYFPDLVDRLSEVKKSIDDSDSTAKRVNDRTEKMVDKVNNEMMPKLRELQAIHEDRYEDVFVTCKLFLGPIWGYRFALVTVVMSSILVLDCL